MTRHDTRPTIPDIALERYRLGELEQAERAAIAERLAVDDVLRARLASLEQSDREIAGRYAAAVMAEEIRRRAAQQDRLADAGRRGREERSAWRAWLVPAAGVCLVAIAASLWIRPSSTGDTTIKGGDATLVVHRRLGESSEELRHGAPVRQGDQIRIGYRAAGKACGAILSVDGRGTLTQHLPRSGDRAAPLEPSGTVFLDFAYELDDAPRWEVFYFVTSDAAFDLEPVRREVQRAAAAGSSPPFTLDLPRGLAQSAFPLSKDLR